MILGASAVLAMHFLCLRKPLVHHEDVMLVIVGLPAICGQQVIASVASAHSHDAYYYIGPTILAVRCGSRVEPVLDRSHWKLKSLLG